MLLIVAGGVGAVAYYMTAREGNVKPASVKPNVAVTKPNVNVTPVSRDVTVFLPVSEPNRFYLVPESRSSSDVKSDKLDVAMQTMLATQNDEGEAGMLIPKGTKMLSPVKVENGVAVVDLSKEFVENFSGGSTQEALVLNAIGHTLVENSNGRVEKVQILVEGKKIDTLGGHFELLEPLDVDSTLLKSGSSD